MRKLDSKALFISLAFIIAYSLQDLSAQDFNDYTFASFSSSTAGTLSGLTLSLSATGSFEVDGTQSSSATPILPSGFSNLPTRSVNALRETSGTYSTKTISFDANLPANAVLLIEDLDHNEEYRITFKDNVGTIIDPSANVTQYMPTSGAPTVVTNTSTITLTGTGPDFSYPVVVLELTTSTVRSIEVEVRNHPSGGNSHLFLAALTSTLPVEYLSFEVKPLDSFFAEVLWETASEVNHDFFTVERSEDLNIWREITKIPGQGTQELPTKYRYVDKLPNSNLHYYRIKQTDIDGTFSYSKTKSVQIDAKSTLNIYLNPSSEVIFLEGNTDTIEQLQIRDMNGKIWREFKALQSQGGIFQIDISALASGVYFLSTDYHYQKIFKQ